MLGAYLKLRVQNTLANTYSPSILILSVNIVIVLSKTNKVTRRDPSNNYNN